jgi:hypothetical protein
VNAVSALAVDQQESSISSAATIANKWVTVAEPVLKAFWALEEIECALRSAGFAIDPERHYRAMRGAQEQALHEAADILTKPTAAIFDMLESIRDGFRCDAQQPGHSYFTAEDWHENIAFNDALDERIVTVVDFVKQMEAAS